jgi:hypothetical protein
VRLVVLGAGFGGLELSTRRSNEVADEVEVTLIDQSDAFVFGFSKLDVVCGRRTADEVRLLYRDIAKPGVVPSGDDFVDRPGAQAGRHQWQHLQRRRSGCRLGSGSGPGGDARTGRGRLRVLLARRRGACARDSARPRLGRGRDRGAGRGSSSARRRRSKPPYCCTISLCAGGCATPSASM